MTDKPGGASKRRRKARKDFGPLLRPLLYRRNDLSGPDLLHWLTRELERRIEALYGKPSPPPGEIIMGSHQQVVFDYERLLVQCRTLDSLEVTDLLLIQIAHCDANQHAANLDKNRSRTGPPLAAAAKAAKTDRKVLRQWRRLEKAGHPIRGRVKNIWLSTRPKIPESTVRDSIIRLKEAGKI